jgi:nucleoside-diphosphate-sugar epimerase
MRVLITGLEGFTGHYLKVELEERGHEVIGLFSDLTDAAAVKNEVTSVKPDGVVHLAGISFVGHGDVDAFYHVNLIGTRHLLSALAESEKPPHIVLLVSSANIYGNSTEGMLSEDIQPNPANDYAVSKLAMEHMARLWFDKLPIVITRPFNYTGVGQSESFLLPKIVAHFRSRAPMIELGNLDVWRDFSDVRVVAQAYRRLLEVAPSGGVVNVCSGKTHSLREALKMAESITGHNIEVRVNPAFVRANEVKTLCGDPSRLRALVGELESISLENTLRWMLGEGN